MTSAVHLTEEQVDDYLIGDLAAEHRVHLSSCMECQARVAKMEGAIEGFKTVSLAWSERQSATMPVRLSQVKAEGSRTPRAVWAATAAAAVAVGVAVPLAHRAASSAPEQSAVHQPPSPSQTFAAEREEQIAQDNEMLQAINQEIAAPVRSPSETFGLELSGRSQGTHSGAQRD